MPLYIIEIPGSEFTGFKGGVDFFKGKGSTSSKDDAISLMKLCGCKISERFPLIRREAGPKPESIETKTGGGPAGPPSASSTPSGETPKEPTPKPGNRKGGKRK